MSNEIEPAHQDALALPRGDEGVIELSPDGGTISATFKFESFYFSPIPHPDMMEGYQKVLPGSPDRILSMAERQQKHRHNVDKSLVRISGWEAVSEVGLRGYDNCV